MEPCDDGFEKELSTITSTLAEVSGRMSKLQDLYNAALVRCTGELSVHIEEIRQNSLELIDEASNAPLLVPQEGAEKVEAQDSFGSHRQSLHMLPNIPSDDVVAPKSPSDEAFVPLFISSLSEEPVRKGGLVKKGTRFEAQSETADDSDKPGLYRAGTRQVSKNKNVTATNSEVTDHSDSIATGRGSEVSDASRKSLASQKSFATQVSNGASILTTVSKHRFSQVSVALRPVWEEAKADAEDYISAKYTIGVVVASRLFKTGSSVENLKSKMTSESLSSWLWCNVMNPIGNTRICWHAVSLVLIMFDVFIIPLQAFNLSDHPALSFLEWFATIFWTLDMIFMFRTGYIIGATLEMRPKRIAIHYAQTWLVVDLLIVAIEWVSRFWGVSSSASVLRSSRILRSIRLLKLLRLGKMRVIYTSLIESLNSNVLHLFITLLGLATCLMLSIHFASCVWYAVGESRPDGWTSYDAYTGRKDFLFWYVESSRWVIAQLNGRTDIDDRRNMRERLYTCICGILFAVLARSLCTSFITKTMLDLNALVSAKTNRNRLVNQYMESHPVCPELQRSVKRYVLDYTDVAQEQQSEAMILSILPRHVQSELLVEVRSPVLVGHPLFKSCASESKWSMRLVCCRAVTVVTAVKFDIVFDKGEDCTRMLFLDKVRASYGEPSHGRGGEEHEPEEEVQEHWSSLGANHSATAMETFYSILFPVRRRQLSPSQRLTVSNSDSRFTGGASKLLDLDSVIHSQMAPGSWISEPALFTEWINRGRLVSENHGYMYAVNVDALASGLKKYPAIFALAALYGTKIVALLKEAETHSDILGFHVDVLISQRNSYCSHGSASMSSSISRSASGDSLQSGGSLS